MARLIETKENEEIGLYTKDSLTGRVKRVGEFSPNGGGFILGSAGVDGVPGTESDNIKFHRGGPQVLQIIIGSDTTPDGELAPQSSLAKINGVSYSNYVIGSLTQFNNGEATHSSLASAVSGGVPEGSKIAIIGTTADSADVTINNKVFVEGIGNNAALNCNLILGSSSSKSLIKYVRFLGDLTINDGSNNNIITDCWIVSTGNVNDNNANPNNLITILQEV